MSQNGGKGETKKVNKQGQGEEGFFLVYFQITITDTLSYITKIAYFLFCINTPCIAALLYKPEFLPDYQQFTSLY